jgi:hypothetical protein
MIMNLDKTIENLINLLKVEYKEEQFQLLLWLIELKEFREGKRITF